MPARTHACVEQHQVGHTHFATDLLKQFCDIVRLARIAVKCARFDFIHQRLKLFQLARRKRDLHALTRARSRNGRTEVGTHAYD